METDSINYEPPAKTVKIDVHQYPSLYIKLHLTGLFDINKLKASYTLNLVRKGT